VTRSSAQLLRRAREEHARQALTLRRLEDRFRDLRLANAPDAALDPIADALGETRALLEVARRKVLELSK
jgi:hypothetical protein